MSEYVTGTNCSRGDFAVSEKESSRIDLDALAADLTAAGWRSFRKIKGRFWYSYRRVQVIGQTVEAWQAGDGEIEPVSLADPIWQHAIDIIRTHTQAGA